MRTNRQEAVLSAYVAPIGKRTPRDTTQDAVELCTLAPGGSRTTEQQTDALSRGHLPCCVSRWQGPDIIRRNRVHTDRVLVASVDVCLHSLSALAYDLTSRHDRVEAQGTYSYAPRSGETDFSFYANAASQ